MANEQLKKWYDDQYDDYDKRWRELGAKGKAGNILELLNGMDISQLVEVGAGDGSVLKVLIENNISAHYTALEISESGVKRIRENLGDKVNDVVRFDGLSIPFDDGQFDLAICTHVIEHVEEPRSVLREIKRISKYQIFEVPIDFSFRVDKKFDHFMSYGHINIYTPQLFNFLLLSEGFKIIKSKSSLYPREVVDFQFKRFTVQYILKMIKRVVWKTIPPLMRIKPETYTVLTQ